VSNKENLRVIHNLAEAVNARNWDHFTELFAESVIFTHPVFSEPQKGVAVIKEFFNKMTTSLDLHIEKKRAFESGDLCCVEWITSGTNIKPLELPGNPPIPATNKSFKINSVAVFKVENDKITEYNVYVDRIGLLKQLGIKPS